MQVDIAVTLINEKMIEVIWMSKGPWVSQWKYFWEFNFSWTQCYHL